MNDPTSVTVIIPAYNAEAFIGRAIASVAAQTLPPHEILIVDDCSTDGTRRVIEAAAKSNPLIKLIAMQRNGGPSVARNAAIDAANGTWLAILDADDAFASARLAKLIPFAVETGADLVADDLAYYDAAAGCVTGRGMGDEAAAAKGLVSLRDFLAHNLASGEGLDWGLLKPIFRRSTLIEHGIRYEPDMRHGEDFRLVVELLCRGAQFRLLSQPLYLYTQRQGAVSGRSSGMTRTTIAYHALRDAALALSRDPRLASDTELVALLQLRARGLGRLDDAHFISRALRSAALWQIAARSARDPSFFPYMLRHIGRAVRRRVSGSGRALSR
jgi:succinoglycan biosynthesis protein ExoO